MSDWKESLAKIAKKNFGLTLVPHRELSQIEKEALKLNHVNHISSGKQAKAPYNFIPLNDKVVMSKELPGEGECTFDRYHKSKNTGYIKLTIKTETPLYIRDTLDKDEVQLNDGEKNLINPDFFSPGKKIRIPGSSLRGMIRTMVEMLSFGKFGFFDNKRLCFRGVADRSRLGSDYKDIMIDEKDNCFPNIKAGILKKLNQSYVIYPSKSLPVGSGGTQIYRINFDKTTKIVDGTTGFVVPCFEFRDVYFKPLKPQPHTHYRWNNYKKVNEPYKLKYAKLASVSDTKDAQHPQKGFIIASGEFGTKKHLHWVINEPDSKPDNKYIPVDERVIKEYKDDSSRDEGADLLEKLKVYKSGVPCFYILNDRNEVTSFGHTGMFRLAYEKTIGEHIPPELQDETKVDIVEAIFGNEKKFAGRVFFEDAFLQKPTDDDYEEVRISKTLLGPKPTTFQHYLVQTEENLNNHPRNLAHYNSSNAIRGNKLYWHKSAQWEKDNQKEFNPKIEIQMRPIKSGRTFIGKVRFENLSDIELGALLFALELPPDCCHKLGMGKPLGLGSVRITPTLILSDRKKRYTDLFTEWPLKESAFPNKGIAYFKGKFEKHILEEIKETKTKLWKVDRMKELKTMLIFDKSRSDEKTRYMTIEPDNEFKERKVLPKPTNVHPLPAEQ
ncbi:MAG: TIGR03986 family CRISPR-associated RAMP protein [wastewater metagenome]|nr:TIGR03986 family CRISPR-associated RAMP protein [Candidatus Loosdrechtia aerotolerans]